MSIIRKEVLFRGSKGEAKFQVLFDTGATYSIIRKDLAEAIESPTALPEPMGLVARWLRQAQPPRCSAMPPEFETAEVGSSLTARERTGLNFYFDKDRFSDEFLVLEKLSEEVIIGVHTLQKWRMKLNFDEDRIEYDPKVTKLILKTVLFQSLK